MKNSRAKLNWFRLACVALALQGLFSPLASVAQEAPTFQQFTFKRVTVGEGQPGKRITVQIDPNEQQAYLDATAYTYDGEDGDNEEPSDVLSPDIRTVVQPDLPYEWFWQLISPELNAANGGRLDEAVAALSLGPEGQIVPAPSLDHMRQLAKTYGKEILISTFDSDVSPALVLAVISVESAGRTDAVSSAGAQGLMQLMPATAERFSVKDRTSPKENITGGVKYLDWLLGEFKMDPLLALAGYNAGENAVLNNAGIPPYAETRAYVPKVLAGWQVARQLCKTPPELISDGCVFADM